MPLVLPIVSCGFSIRVPKICTRMLRSACVLQERARVGCRGLPRPVEDFSTGYEKTFSKDVASVATPVERLYTQRVTPTLTHDDPGIHSEPPCVPASFRSLPPSACIGVVSQHPWATALPRL